MSSVVRGSSMGAELSPPISDFVSLISQEGILRLLEGPLARMGCFSQVIILRGLGDMAERAFNISVPHIWRAVGRLQKRAHRLIVPGQQRSYQEYWDIAAELAPGMAPGESYVLKTALQSRSAAILGVAIEMALRRGELGGLQLANVFIDDRHQTVDVVVPADLRKDGDTFQATLSKTVSGLVIEYVQRSRPFLLDYGGAATEYLWVSRAGGALTPQGVVNTLRRRVKQTLGETASCILFRRANASRDDINERETFLWLRQSRRSRLGQELYAQRDREEAQRCLLDIWGSVRL